MIGTRRGSAGTDSLWALLDLGDPAATDWMRDAVCAQSDPEAFFPEPGQPNLAVEARAVCAWCPVLVECRDWAIARPGVTGIWGGTSDRERQAMRRRTRQAETAAAVDRLVV